MSLKSKMYLGLGFLFFIIFGLGFFYSYHIGKISRESGNILKDNYASLVFSKNMLTALDDMQAAIGSSLFNPNTDKAGDYSSKIFASGKIEFENNMKAEMNNVTEIHEEAFVKILTNSYDIYLNLSEQIQKGLGDRSIYFNGLMPAYEKLRESIISISEINMQAIERKNLITKQDAARAIKITAIIGTICLLLAFAYFWYFPFYVSTSLSYLSEKMKILLKKAGITADLKTEDEAQIILQGINLLENKFGGGSHG